MLVELSVMEQRYHAVMEVVSGAPVSEVARRYGVSRQAVHGWLGRYEREGLERPAIGIISVAWWWAGCPSGSVCGRAG